MKMKLLQNAKGKVIAGALEPAGKSEVAVAPVAAKGYKIREIAVTRADVKALEKRFPKGK